MCAQLVRIADARKHQKLGRVECSGTKNNLFGSFDYGVLGSSVNHGGIYSHMIPSISTPTATLSCRTIRSTGLPVLTTRLPGVCFRNAD